MARDGPDLAYPTVEDILAIHETVVANDANTEAGVRTQAAIESALTYVSEGFFGQKPDGIHESAAALMRLLVAEHPFVDGNKRTALYTVAALYAQNGLVFEFDDDVRRFLTGFAIDADAVDMADVVSYLDTHTRPAKDR